MLLSFYQHAGKFNYIGIVNLGRCSSLIPLFEAYSVGFKNIGDMTLEEVSFLFRACCLFNLSGLNLCLRIVRRDIRRFRLYPPVAGVLIFHTQNYKKKSLICTNISVQIL